MSKFGLPVHFRKLESFFTFINGFQTKSNPKIYLSKPVFTAAQSSLLFDDVERHVFKLKTPTTR